MKILFRFFILILCSVTIQMRGQEPAVLPSSWNFDTQPPVGWSESLGDAGATRYSQGKVGQACRLDLSGEYVLVHFAQAPGEVNYYIKGQPAGTNWQGTFVVEESTNGTAFTAMRTFTSFNIPLNSFTEYTDLPSFNSRYIRFRFEQKSVGNVALDEVSVSPSMPTNTQEINVTYNGSTIPSGLVANVGNGASSNFTIENIGLAESLVISNVELSGTNANQFSLSNVPTSIVALSSSTFQLLFDGQGVGSKYAILTIYSNDPEQPEYIIQIEAVAGEFASEPTSQASNISFTQVVSWDYNVSFSGPEQYSYLVLRRKGTPPLGAPQDGVTYVKGQWIEDGQVVYVGQSATFNARFVEVGTAYHFAIYSFAGSAGFENYLTANPKTGSISTPQANPGITYNNVNPNSNEFVSQLSQAINPWNYNRIPYSSFIATVVDEFYVRDTAVAGLPMNMIECQYSGLLQPYEAGFQFTLYDFSREHSYPQSWMPTNTAPNFTEANEYSDLHMLLPTRQSDVNSVRGNYPFGIVVSPQSTFLNSKFGNNAQGEKVYEPQSKSKGDAARAMLYQALKYTTDQDDFSLPEYISATIPYGQNEYVLKQWHFQDMPDHVEKAHNEYVATKQNNRNPFIDHPEFACYIRFSDMTKWVPQISVSGNVLTALDQGINYQWYLNGEAINGANSSVYTAAAGGDYTVSVQQFEQCPLVPGLVTKVMEIDNQPSMVVYPNPNNGSFSVRSNGMLGQKERLRIMDMTGKVVYEEMKKSSDNSEISIITTLEKGVYILEVKREEGRAISRVIVE